MGGRAVTLNSRNSNSRYSNSRNGVPPHRSVIINKVLKHGFQAANRGNGTRSRNNALFVNVRPFPLDFRGLVRPPHNGPIRLNCDSRHLDGPHPPLRQLYQDAGEHVLKHVREPDHVRPNNDNHRRSSSPYPGRRHHRLLRRFDHDRDDELFGRAGAVLRQKIRRRASSVLPGPLTSESGTGGALLQSPP